MIDLRSATAVHRALVALVVVLGASACAPDEAPSDPGVAPVRVLVFQDGSVADALELVSPSVLALQLALDEAVSDGLLPPGSGVQVVETGGDPGTALAAAGRASLDPAVLAAFVAPLWAQPRAATDILEAAGIPTLSASTMDDPGSADGWRRLVPAEHDLARAVARASQEAARGANVCIGGDDRFEERRLAVMSILRTRAVPMESVPADVDGGIANRDCGAVAWAGSSETALALRHTLDDAGGHEVSIVGFDTVKTLRYLRDGFPDVAGTVAVSGCADVSTSADPETLRFVHDVQAATGLDPGSCAVEGYDAGTLIVSLASDGADGAANDAIGDLRRYDGLVSRYTWTRAGHLATPRVRMYEATGVRWIEAPGAPASA